MLQQLFSFPFHSWSRDISRLPLGKKFNVKVTSWHLQPLSAEPVTLPPQTLVSDTGILCWVTSEQFQPFSVWFMLTSTAVSIPVCSGIRGTAFPSSSWGQHWSTKEETLCCFWLGFLKPDYGTGSSNEEMKIHHFPVLSAWSDPNTCVNF